MEKELSFDPIEKFKINDGTGAILEVKYFVEKDILITSKWNFRQKDGVVINLKEKEAKELYLFLKKHYEGVIA